MLGDMATLSPQATLEMPNGIILTSHRCIGVEIEAVGLTVFDAARILKTLPCPVLLRAGFGIRSLPSTESRFNYWQVMTDDTLRPDENMEADRTFEVASPILQPAHRPFLTHVLAALRQQGARVNDSCAFQVQTDMRDVWPDPALRLRVKKNLALLYMLVEPVLEDWLRPYPGRTPYAKRLRCYIRDDIAEDAAKRQVGIQSLSEEMFDRLFCHNKIKPALQFRGGEYQSAEFRLHNGTLEPVSAMRWIGVCQGLTDLAISAARGDRDITSLLSKDIPQAWPLLRQIAGESVLPPEMPLMDKSPAKNTIHPAGRSDRLGFDPSRRARG